MRLLPYLHPFWQILSLAIAVWTLSLGLRMRARRRSHAARRSGGGFGTPRLVRTHVRAGITFVSTISMGYAAGPLTLGLVRGEAVYETAHAYFASLTLVLLLVGGGLGLRLARSRGQAGDPDLHAFCMGIGLFLSLVTAMLGLGLLP